MSEQTTDFESIDWPTLERLRAGFLDGSAGRTDYWHGEADLASYDQTFGRRIGWKWDFLLTDLKRRGWSPPPGTILDWGCGSGIAARSFLEHFPPRPAAPLFLWDRSETAMRFAAGRVRCDCPGLDIAIGQPDGPPATLLVSHVITELSPRQHDDLLAQAAAATAVLWAEPGTHQASRALIDVRERLRDRFGVVAPCTHGSACGLTAAGMEQHWCHFFAPSPPEVFTDGQWVRFGRLAGIDLRSLPLSLLVLDRRPPPALPQAAVRIIGRPRIDKAHATAFVCDRTGVRERRSAKRADPQRFKEFKRGRFETLQAWPEKDPP